MTKRITTLFTLITIILLPFILNAQNNSKEDKQLREKIAQMLIIGFRGMELSPKSEIYGLIAKEKIGRSQHSR